jgi:hypothetical protein
MSLGAMAFMLIAFSLVLLSSCSGAGYITCGSCGHPQRSAPEL